MGSPEVLYETSVPVGKEHYFADMLAKEHIIKASFVNSTGRIR